MNKTPSVSAFQPDDRQIPAVAVSSLVGRLDLSGRTAIVTGAGRGIGRATCLNLAALGANVALVARTASEVDEVAAEIVGGGGTATSYSCDVADFDRVEAVVKDIIGVAGGVQIVVNNVGGAPWLRELQDVSPEDFEYAVRLNLGTTQNLMRAAAPSLFESPGRSSVINVTSIAQHAGLEKMSFYSASKAGVAGLSKAAAREWGPRGVRVNCIAPGWIETQLSSGLRSTDEFFNATIDRIPLQRWGRPEEVADAITFLASDAAAYVTGTVLYVDGGILA
jgi:NAD(P)-dependent dehydrogenase (short-subunit alcohol dehydrogenase family)